MVYVVLRRQTRGKEDRKIVAAQRQWREARVAADQQIADFLPLAPLSLII